MLDLSELFWSSTTEEIIRGYKSLEDKEFICLICGKTYEKGLIYTEQSRLMEAEKAVQSHVDSEHEGMFEYLLSMNKKYTGLTEHQQNLVRFFNQGYSDKEIVQQLGGGSTSTIRNHRFSLKEREKQAKIFLAIMSLLNSREEGGNKLMNVHRTATMIDERYACTDKEKNEVISRYFYIDENNKEKMSEFPSKQKRKIIAMQHILKRFDSDKEYNEKEVNRILEEVYDGYVTLRRYLIEYGFMDRTNDCSSYWVKK